MTADLGADMQHFDSSPLSVVVGIDGSRSGIVAALWAVDEAVSRDIPLRLVYAIEPSDNARLDAHVAAEELETAEAPAPAVAPCCGPRALESVV